MASAKTTPAPFIQFASVAEARTAAARQILASDLTVLVQNCSLPQVIDLVQRLGEEEGSPAADNKILAGSGAVRPERISELCERLMDQRDLFGISGTL